jgi:hypothetical protein
MASEAAMANAIVRISSRKMSAAIPLTSRNGSTAARFVSVAAVTADETSRAPSAAAASGVFPSASRCRKMFSSMTIELSSSSPTPSARPPRLMMFSVRPP